MQPPIQALTKTYIAQLQWSDETSIYNMIKQY
jgi:hypothetical protein